MKTIRGKEAIVSIVFAGLLLAVTSTHAVSLSYPDISNVVGDSPRHIISENLDGLHQTDLVVSNYKGDTITILLSNGSGGYNSTTLTTAEGVGEGPFSAAFGDIDGDTDTDLVVGNFDGNTVSVFTNNGSGVFTAVADSPLTLDSVSGRPHGLDVADINGDTHLDIVTANLEANTVSVLFGDGVGGFGKQTNIPVGTTPYHVRAADLDGDTDDDLVVPNRDDNTITILLNDGSGTLTVSAQSPIAVGEGPRFVEVANVVGTPSVDIVVANTDGDSVTVLEGDGAAGFNEVAGSPISVGDKPNHVAIGDLDGDMDNDLVTTDEARFEDGKDTISVLVNNGLAGFSRIAFPPAGERVYGSVVTDLDGDADNDIAQSNAGNDYIGIYLNVGAGLPPQAQPDGPGAPYTTVKDTPVDITAPGVLSNDSDNESAILFAVNHTPPANGELRKFSVFGGSFTYRPRVGFVGTDTFKYTINDGSQDGNTVTVSISVTP